jgi:hypothetical protein
MIDENSDAIQAQAKAAADRDPAALRVAGGRLVAWVVATEGSTGPLFDTSIDKRLIGSALLIGEAERVVANYLTRHGRRTWSETEPSSLLALIPEAEYTAWDLDQIIEWRLLARDWRPLPAPAVARLAMLRADGRRRIRWFDALFAAMASNSAAGTAKAIDAIARADKRRFSVLAYALYQEARSAGIAVTVPRKYGF